MFARVLLGVVIAIAGSASTVAAVEVAVGTWTNRTLSRPRYDLAVQAAGGRVLFAGGQDGAQKFDTVDVYNVDLDTWSLTTLAEPRSGMGSTSYGDRYVFFAGGWTDAGYATTSSCVDVWDAQLNGGAGGWAPIANLSMARGSLTAAVAGTKVLFVGGDRLSNTASGVVVVDVLNMATGAWSVRNLNQLAYWLAGTGLGGKAYFSANSAYNPSIGDESTLFVFDASDDSWTYVNSRVVPTRWYASAAATLMGTPRVFFAGGQVRPEGNAGAQVNVIDAASPYAAITSDGTQPLVKVRQTMAAAVVDVYGATDAASGTTPIVGQQILFGGGQGFQGIVDVVDVYDGATGAKNVTAFASAQPRFELSGVGYRNRAYFAGGRRNFATSISAAVDIYTAPVSPGNNNGGGSGGGSPASSAAAPTTVSIAAALVIGALLRRGGVAAAVFA